MLFSILTKSLSRKRKEERREKDLRRFRKSLRKSLRERESEKEKEESETERSLKESLKERVWKRKRLKERKRKIHPVKHFSSPAEDKVGTYRPRDVSLTGPLHKLSSPVSAPHSSKGRKSASQTIAPFIALFTAVDYNVLTPPPHVRISWEMQILQLPRLTESDPEAGNSAD